MWSATLVAIFGLCPFRLLHLLTPSHLPISDCKHTRKFLNKKKYFKIFYSGKFIYVCRPHNPKLWK